MAGAGQAATCYTVGEYLELTRCESTSDPEPEPEPELYPLSLFFSEASRLTDRIVADSRFYLSSLTTTYGSRCSTVLGPMPDTRRKLCSDSNRPCNRRSSTIRAA